MSPLAVCRGAVELWCGCRGRRQGSLRLRCCRQGCGEEVRPGLREGPRPRVLRDGQPSAARPKDGVLRYGGAVCTAPALWLLDCTEPRSGVHEYVCVKMLALLS